MNTKNKEQIKERIANAKRAKANPDNFSDPQFTRDDWKNDVKYDNTFLGFIDWTIEKLTYLISYRQIISKTCLSEHKFTANSEVCRSCEDFKTCWPMTVN